MVISDYILHGPENALTAREIGDRFNLSPRAVSRMVEAERRAGWPICASCDAAHPGYYLAENEEQLHTFIKSLEGREREIRTTRRALQKVRMI